ncbi:peptide deformylase, partial [Meiothermus taiwanensis]
MAEILPIRLYGDPVLKKKALPVQDFSGIPQLAENMLETMFEARGVGLAAPQVG